MYQIPLDNINFRPLDIWGLGVAAITDFLYYDPDPQYVNNASITNRGTSGTNAVGYSGKSYDCDGVSDFADTGQLSTFERTDTLDLSVWVKIDSAASTTRIVGNIESASPFSGFSLFTIAGDLSFQLVNSSVTNELSVQTVNTVTLNKWLLVRITYDGSSDPSGIAIFIDGVSQSLTTVRNNLTSSIISTNNIEFGSYGNGTGQFFNGQISDCPITINGTLVHYFEFNQASATGIFDSVQKVLATNSGCALIEGLSGLENSETHNGIPQCFSKNWNRYSSTSLTGTTSLSGTALTGSGTTFTTELSANDIVRVAGNIARVTSVTDNTNAVVVNITSGSWSAQSTVRLRLGGSDQLLPEDANNAGFDVGGLAIVDPQPKFKLDGASYGNTGQTVAIDYNTPFTITANGVYIYDSTSNNAIFSNRDNTANQRGILAYLDTSNRPVLLMQLNTTTRVQVQSNVAISNDDNIQWISGGTGDASGVTLKINAAAVATTTLQDQDISAGITSAANAYFGIDLDGTTNELTGSTGIITLDL